MKVHFTGSDFIRDDLIREALETGLLVSDDGTPVEIRIVQDYSVGIRTTGPDITFRDIMHRECTRALTEDNPLWNEFNHDKPRYRKPKDLGSKPGVACTVVELHWGTRDEAARFARNRARFVRAVVHAIVHHEFLSHR